MADKKLKLGIFLQPRERVRPSDVDDMIAMAERVEEAGLDSVWIGDQLTSQPRLEPLSVLAAVAARTRRVRLGTAVLLAARRHPWMLAHLAGTVDLISKGRLVLGIGIGNAGSEAGKAEWRAAGVDSATRAGRLEELVEIVKGLTAGEEVTFRGRHFQLDSVRIEPNQSQPGGVPILLACHWHAGRERQFQRAARLADGFISVYDLPEEFTQAVDRMRHYTGQEGKDFNTMEAAFHLSVNLNRDGAQAVEEAERYLMWEYGSNIRGGRCASFGPPELTVERIKEYAQAGVGTLIIRFASFDHKGQLDTFLREVVPAL